MIFVAKMIYCLTELTLVRFKRSTIMFTSRKQNIKERHQNSCAEVGQNENKGRKVQFGECIGVTRRDEARPRRPLCNPIVGVGLRRLFRRCNYHIPPKHT